MSCGGHLGSASNSVEGSVGSADSLEDRSGESEEEERERKEEEREEFLEACGDGWVEDVLEYAGDVDEVVKGQNTGLTEAAREGEDEVVAALITQRGADPSRLDGRGMTPLHWSVINGHKSTVHLLASLGAHVDARNKNGLTPVMDAANIEMLRVLVVDHGADPTPPPDEFGEGVVGWLFKGRQLTGLAGCGWEAGWEGDFCQPIDHPTEGAREWLLQRGLPPNDLQARASKRPRRKRKKAA